MLRQSVSFMGKNLWKDWWSWISSEKNVVSEAHSRVISLEKRLNLLNDEINWLKERLNQILHSDESQFDVIWSSWWSEIIHQAKQWSEADRVQLRINEIKEMVEDVKWDMRENENLINFFIENSSSWLQNKINRIREDMNIDEWSIRFRYGIQINLSDLSNEISELQKRLIHTKKLEEKWYKIGDTVKIRRSSWDCSDATIKLVDMNWKVRVEWISNDWQILYKDISVESFIGSSINA